MADDYSRLIELVSYRDVIDSARPTVLGIDLSWHHCFPASSTAPWQLDAVLQALTAGGIPQETITAFTSETDGISTKFGGILNRHGIVLERHGVRAFVDVDSDAWTIVKPEIACARLNNSFPDGIRIPRILAESNLVLLPTMKTHVSSVLAGSLYTSFGVLLGRGRRRCLSGADEIMADALAVLKDIGSGVLAVMDGTIAGEGPGPCRLVPHVKNVIAASTDPVALDAAAARLMGFDPMAVPAIRMAHERGLGTGDVREIEMVGDDVSGEDFGFGTAASWPDRLLWKLETNTVFPFTHRLPLIYNDFFWYMAVGEKRISRIMKSGWGKLFETYRK